MFLGLPTDVLVQAQFHADHAYIAGIGHNLHALTIGAGDWVDPDLFGNDPTLEKRYDVIMVASWLTLKRHRVLFAALRQIADAITRVVLVGYSLGGRTQEDIRREAAQHGVGHLVDIYESVPPATVSRLLQQSRVSVMLTRREGANRAIYESLFSNTPVIVTKDNIGVNRDHVNAHTGLFSSDADLPTHILRVVRGELQFSPRPWALAHTGYRNSTRTLNLTLRELAVRSGERWTSDIYAKKNAPNAMYADASERLAAREQLCELDRFLSL